MPKFLEDKLKKTYPNNPSAVFGTMNKIGAMHGNKETELGREMTKKHESSEGEESLKNVRAPKKKKLFAEALNG